MVVYICTVGDAVNNLGHNLILLIDLKINSYHSTMYEQLTNTNQGAKILNLLYMAIIIIFSTYAAL